MLFTTLANAIATKPTPVNQVDQPVYFYLPVNATTDFTFYEKCETDFTWFYQPLQVQCFIQGVKAQIIDKKPVGLLTFKAASRWFRTTNNYTIDQTNAFISNILLDNPSNAPITSLNFVTINRPKTSSQKEDLRQHKDYIHRNPHPIKKFIDDDDGDDLPDDDDVQDVKPATSITRVQCVAACTPPNVVL